jgi:methanogenic corrinoid protein MtbC1
MNRKIVDALVTFDEKAVMEVVHAGLDNGEDPMGILRDLQEGMRIVGEKFSKGDYFLSELIMSADLFSRAMKIIEPRLVGKVRETIGRMVIGTPKGDIHDIGKNIFATVARGAGLEVHDLGVDVPVDRFVKAVEEVKPDIVGFSALITTAFEPMKKVVDALAEKGMRDRLKVIIGGGVTTDMVKTYVGADAQTNDAVRGLAMCKEFMGR